MTGAAFNRDVKVFISRHLSPDERAGVLARYARKQVAELIRSGAASPVFERFVDGREGVPEEQVKPEGRITYVFASLGRVVLFALAFLQARSPVRSGRYRDGFVIGVDGRYMTMRSFRPELVPEDAEIVILNRMPYSRKADVQLVGTRRLRFSVPPMFFDDAARAVRSRYPLFDARRFYSMKFPGGYILKTGREAGRQVQSPALVIRHR